MGGILEKIAKVRLQRLALEKLAVCHAAIEEKACNALPAHDFSAAFSGPGIHVIAEIKKASPSKGILKADLDPVAMARSYEQGGASAVSVLTEEDHFQGSISVLGEVRGAASLPILRKDFILDPYQVLEARAAGADSFLLIAGLLDLSDLRMLTQLGRDYGMEPLVEVHDEPQLKTALDAGAKLIGINNRDLKTFHTDLNVSTRLAKLIPNDRIIVSESGIKNRADILHLADHGVRGFLIGESLVISDDPVAKLQELIHG
ncbi:MAG: indole-3-glycerol phosphate synthase TrpC [Desulfomonile tiedjei]|uniref:Indole-3-glycerol phosphate synthase n=1 Tax=Desulfomonile tiedjei TaxID=2358 RepID=A0A9D6Z8Y0_9BACT|nr:indole-3-glycerol phosphate synthase TrpC [Desulfomonile tiedjei]